MRGFYTFCLPLHVYMYFSTVMIQHNFLCNILKHMWKKLRYTFHISILIASVLLIFLFHYFNKNFLYLLCKIHLEQKLEFACMKISCPSNLKTRLHYKQYFNFCVIGSYAVFSFLQNVVFSGEFTLFESKQFNNSQQNIQKD